MNKERLTTNFGGIEFKEMLAQNVRREFYWILLNFIEFTEFYWILL